MAARTVSHGHEVRRSASCLASLTPLNLESAMIDVQAKNFRARSPPQNDNQKSLDSDTRELLGIALRESFADGLGAPLPNRIKLLLAKISRMPPIGRGV